MANERRLIDSAELIAMLPIVEEDKQISLIGAVADVVTMISECQSVDAVEVCYCYKCKFAEFDSKYSKYRCTWINGRLRYSNDYCSYGERRCE